MSERGRKSIYDEKIKSRFKDISKWINKGETEKSIAKKLGVSYSTFNKYKTEKKEFSELLKESRVNCVKTIENTCFIAACGFTKTVKKAMKVKTVDYKDGKRVQEREEVVTYDEETYYPPNATLAIYLLKHWGKGYTNDPESLKLKRKEFEHKKDMDKNNLW